jgi:hypothetical protein
MMRRDPSAAQDRGHERTIGQALPFAVGVGGPVLVFALGERSRAPLDGLRSWMAANNSLIMAVLTLVIGATLFGDGRSGL